jgi:hypothetical protein
LSAGVPGDEIPSLSVGSLLGVPLGSTGQPPIPPLAASLPEPASAAVDEIEGPNWTVAGGNVGKGHQAAWRSDGVEALTFNNPFGQIMERVWFDGKVVYAVDLGEVEVDPDRVKVAQEYQVVYGVELDEHGRARPETKQMVEGQLNIYDTVPGMDRYSPIWQFNYVVVPRDHTPNTLRSEADCLTSGYPIIRSQDFEN